MIAIAGASEKRTVWFLALIDQVDPKTSHLLLYALIVKKVEDEVEPEMHLLMVMTLILTKNLDAPDLNEVFEELISETAELVLPSSPVPSRCPSKMWVWEIFQCL